VRGLAFRLFTECGHDGPLLYPGPLCGGESGSTGRVAGVDRDVDSFSHGQDARSKSPAPAHELAGHGEGMDARVEATQERLPDARQAPSGVAFLFGYLSLWPRKEKVTRAPKAHESSCLNIFDKQFRTSLPQTGSTRSEAHFDPGLQ
jgi:hypothetical protein